MEQKPYLLSSTADTDIQDGTVRRRRKISAITLKPLTSEAKNNDYLAIMQSLLGKHQPVPPDGSDTE